MSISNILFLSNVITKPFETHFNDYEISHAPLDSIIDTLHKKCEYDLLVLLLDNGFFFEFELNESAFEKFEMLKSALIHFRENNSSKIIINTQVAIFENIYSPSTAKMYENLSALNSMIASLHITSLSVIDLFSLALQHGVKNIINEKNRYLFQSPFTKDAITLIAQEIKKSILLFEGRRIKAIAIDADNTLWGGIIGEDGIHGIHIDQNYPGIVYKRFQHYIKNLQKSGIILILLSKNNEADVLEVFERKSMPLKIDDFVALKINWLNKSDNLGEVLKEINLTKDDVIFLDDSHVEIEQMRAMLNIRCFKMNPQNPLENLQTLREIIELQALTLTNEDIEKTSLYKSENERKNLITQSSSKEDFIASLHIEIECLLNSFENLERITQLINKTNQFNLTTKRYDISHVKELMSKHEVFSFSVKDRFGDMGLVGVMIIKEGKIDTFLMSCRVLGREIESTILRYVCTKYDSLEATFIPSSKNSLVENFYEENGFEVVSKNGTKEYLLKEKREPNQCIKIYHKDSMIKR